jgi:hypothetical protein
MNRQQLTGGLRLGMVGCLLAVIWLQVLPWVAAQPKMAAHLEHLDEQGIDPSAMFYTDLDAMEPILKRLERR